MNDPTRLLIGGEDVAAFLSIRVHDLADHVVATLASELPAYARLPRELLRGDVHRVVEKAIRLFVWSLESEGRPDEDQLAQLTESAVRRAEEGVPFEMVLAAYHRGVRVCSDALLASAREGDLTGVLAINRSAMSFLEHVATAVAAGYAQHGRASLADLATASQLLVNALVDGGGVQEAARRAEITLPASYLVVTLAAAAHPDESDRAVDPVVAGRRKLRRLRDEFDRHFGEAVLWIPATDGGLALVPQPSAPDQVTDEDWVRLTRVVADVRRAAGADVHAGVAVATPEEVPAAVVLAREVLDVARTLGRPAGLYRLADVALEYQLTRVSEAQPLLAAQLAPLSGHDDLAETLAAFIATGLNRRRTASAMHVHPNTVDNRLRKVAELTGLDATRPADLPRLIAALTARRLAH